MRQKRLKLEKMKPYSCDCDRYRLARPCKKMPSTVHFPSLNMQDTLEHSPLHSYRTYTYISNDKRLYSIPNGSTRVLFDKTRGLNRQTYLAHYFAFFRRNVLCRDTNPPPLLGGAFCGRRRSLLRQAVVFLRLSRPERQTLQELVVGEGTGEEK